MTIRLRQGLEEGPATGWEVQVMDPAGRPVRHFRGSGKVPHEIVWDGLSDARLPVPNHYLSSYALRVGKASDPTHQAGPSRRIFSFVEAVLQHRRGDPQKGIEIEFLVRGLPFSEIPLRWELEVLDKAGSRAGDFEGRGMPPSSLIWDASKHPNAPEYSYRFRAWPREGESFVLEDRFLPETSGGGTGPLPDGTLPPPPPQIPTARPRLPALPDLGR